MTSIFTGNCPGNVSKDACYSVSSSRSKPGEYEIRLLYRTDNGEQWNATTDEHPELVQMVNAVKMEQTYTPGGRFYINEYHQVIVPAVDSSNYYLTGTYDQLLAFEFEGKVISAEPNDLSGKPLEPGDLWVGPHAGIPYVLAAGGNDIYYKRQPRPNVTKEVRLKDVIGPSEARRVAGQIRGVKGFAGGRFYVNERHSIFAPRQDGLQVEYIYIGQLDLKRWFPKPEAH